MSLFFDALVAFPAWGSWVDLHFSNDTGSVIGINAFVIGAVPFSNETPYSGADVEASMEVVWVAVAGTSEMDAAVHVRKGANGRAIAGLYYHNTGTSFILETRRADENVIRTQTILVSGNLVLGDFYRIYVGAQGSSLYARCKHLADGKWLTPAGTWSATAQDCATDTNTPVIGSGNTGMEFFAYGGGSKMQIRNYAIYAVPVSYSALLQVLFAGAPAGMLSGVAYGNPTSFSLTDPTPGREYVLEIAAQDLAGFLAGRMGNVKLHMAGEDGVDIIVRAIELVGLPKTSTLTAPQRDALQALLGNA